MLFQVVNERHLHRRPMVFTTNKAVEEWGRVLHDPDLAEAILDRVLERGRILHFKGPSYRTRATWRRMGAEVREKRVKSFANAQVLRTNRIASIHRRASARRRPPRGFGGSGGNNLESRSQSGSGRRNAVGIPVRSGTPTTVDSPTMNQ